MASGQDVRTPYLSNVQSDRRRIEGIAMPLGWSEDIIAVEPRAFAPDHASGNGSIPARLVDRQNRRSGTRSKRVQDLLLQYALAGNLNGPRRRTDPHRGRVCCRIRALLDLWGCLTDAPRFNCLNVCAADQPVGDRSSAVILGGHSRACRYAYTVLAAGTGSITVDRCRERKGISSPSRILPIERKSCEA